MIAQFTSDIKTKNCVQLLQMQNYALMFDFMDPDRRKNYFSIKTLNFFNRHNPNERVLKNSQTYNEQSGKLRLGNQEEDIQFLRNPYCNVISIINIISERKRIYSIMKSISSGINAPIYNRVKGDDYFDWLYYDLLKFKEVMFARIGDNIYIAPNGANLKLSHPSLLGGYPYEVDDAGTLEMNGPRIIAKNDSGHYGGDRKINETMTKLLFFPLLFQLPKKSSDQQPNERLKRIGRMIINMKK